MESDWKEDPLTGFAVMRTDILEIPCYIPGVFVKVGGKLVKIERTITNEYSKSDDGNETLYSNYAILEDGSTIDRSYFDDRKIDTFNKDGIKIIQGTHVMLSDMPGDEYEYTSLSESRMFLDQEGLNFTGPGVDYRDHMRLICAGIRHRGNATEYIFKVEVDTDTDVHRTAYHKFQQDTNADKFLRKTLDNMDVLRHINVDKEYRYFIKNGVHHQLRNPLEFYIKYKELEMSFLGSLDVLLEEHSDIRE